MPTRLLTGIALIALLGGLASPTARADDKWIQIGDGIHVSQADEDAGTHNESGRLAQVSLAWDDAQNRTVVWAGASHGGLWKAQTNKSGKITGWTPLTDDFPGSHVLGSFAVRKHDSSHIVVGTGAFEWGDGDGIYYTTNGGQNWHVSTFCVSLSSCAPSSGTARVNRIVADRSDSTGMALVAATSDGIWKSFDFGETWFSVLSGAEATDVVQDTGDPTRWYAGVVHDGLYLSKDDAVTWKAHGSGFKGSIARMSLAVCKKHQDTLYAIVAKNDNTLNAVYRSTSRGLTWDEIYTDDSTLNPDAQSLHTCSIACDPTDRGHIVFGLVKSAESTNADAKNPGSVKATIFDGGHNDYNFFRFEKVGSSVRLHIANDGGYYRYDFVNPVDDSANVQGLDVLELGGPKTGAPSGLQGGLASSWSEPDEFAAGLQDNGVIRANVSHDAAIHKMDGGDGRHVSIMPSDPGTIGYNNNGGKSGDRHISEDGTLANVDFELTAEQASAVLIDPTPQLTKPKVFTSDQFTLFGAPVSGIFYNDATNPQSPWNLVGTHLISSDKLVSNLDVTVDPESYEIVGSLAGDVHVFRYVGDRNHLGSLSYSDITPPLPASPAPSEQDARINADRSNYQPATVYYTSGRGTPRVAFVSRDGGNHWTEVTGDIVGKSNDADLIKLIGNPALEDELFLATSNGIFRSENGGKCWFGWSEGLRTHERVDDVVINFDNLSTPTLYVATHGRGFWQRTLQPQSNPPSCSGGS